MQFGICLPTSWSDYGQRGAVLTVETAAKAAATLGYVSVWATDHVVVPANQSYVRYMLEPLTTLAALIHVVPTLQLGTSALILPQRNALVVAKQAAVLDVLSGGRFILGIGAGWMREEFEFLGADFAQRGAVTDEAIRAMRTLWGEPIASFHGQFYNFDDALFEPKPAPGRPPLWLCGNSRSMLRRAAQFGAAWNPFDIELEALQAGVAYLREQTQGRDLPTIAAHLRIRIGQSGDERAQIAGGVDEVTQLLGQYQAAGLEYLICDFVADDLNDLLRQMELMEQQIVPQLSGE